jgi:hypothetical protein
MTEPQQPDRHSWSEADLPVLTELDDESAAEGVEIPDFDFSTEMEDIKHQLGQKLEPGLEFPPELLLEEAAPGSTASGVALDFAEVPTLDLDAYASAPLQDPAAGHDFEFEFEPAAVAVGSLAKEPEANLAQVSAGEAGPDGAPDAGPVDVPKLDLATVRTDTEPVSAAAAESPAKPDAVVAVDALAVPELSLDDALLNAESTPVSALESPLPASPVEDDLPVGLEVDAIPELSLADALLAAAPAGAEPGDVDVPELTVEDALPVHMGAEPEEPEMDTDDTVVESSSEALVGDVSLPGEDAVVPVAELASQEKEETNAVHAPAETDGFSQTEPAEVVASGEVASDATPATETLAETDRTDTEVPAPESPGTPPPPAAAQTLGAQVEHGAGLADAAGGLTVPEAEGAPFRSISLDSLPRGVLGGGLALAAAEAESQAPSVQDLIRAAELTLAEERHKQALLREQEAAVDVQYDVPQAETEPPADVAPATADDSPPAQAAVMTQADQAPPAADHRPVEIINVAGLASSPAPQSYNLPPVRKSYVTLVDEAMLIDSLYDKILPRMKVELSLWLQDALDHQAKQMLSGVMHQLKEDYEMLFSETLRESLRQAIAEMGREDRGERR